MAAASWNSCRTPTTHSRVIFLPTELATGTGGHVNASFYGKLDRRQIERRVQRLASRLHRDLCLDVSAQLVAGPPEAWRARAVIDLLASTGPPPARGQPILMDQVLERAEELHHDLENASLILDDGWSGRIMPDVPDDEAKTVGARRLCRRFLANSTVAVQPRSSSRLGGSASPTPPEWADTVERLAARIGRHDIEATWDDFLTSLPLSCRKNSSPDRSPPTPLLGRGSFPPGRQVAPRLRHRRLVRHQDAIFGPGWVGKHGADVETLVAELKAAGHEPACEAAERSVWNMPAAARGPTLGRRDSRRLCGDGTVHPAGTCGRR